METDPRGASDRSAVALVEALYAAFAARDEARLREILAPDVAWNQCAGFPGGARHRGADTVLEHVFAALQSEWESFAARIDRYLDAGDHVVVLGEYRGTHVTSRREMTAAFAHVYRVADGRIVEYTQVADTWPIVVAMRGQDG